jgi:uncharacterized protein (TIGR02145 family)
MKTAMNMKTKKLIYPLILIGFVLTITNSCKKDSLDNPSETVTDVDGNVYHTVTIGTQVWMVENLKTTHYKDSTAIPNLTDATEWTSSSSTHAYCSYKNSNNADTIKVYGYLYNWFAVNSGKLCPAGWHVPTDAEWTTLITYLGGEGVAGGKLKETGTAHWANPNTGADNSTGFFALPGGDRTNYGDFTMGYQGYWWSSTENNIALAWGCCLNFSYSTANRSTLLKGFGYSVRCIKGNLVPAASLKID